MKLGFHILKDVKHLLRDLLGIYQIPTPKVVKRCNLFQISWKLTINIVNTDGGCKRIKKNSHDYSTCIKIETNTNNYVVKKHLYLYINTEYVKYINRAVMVHSNTNCLKAF